MKIKRTSGLILVAGLLIYSAAGDEIERVEGGKSPNKQFEVVNIHSVKNGDDGSPYDERHFAIRKKSGELFTPEVSLNVPMYHRGYEAQKVLWRGDSRFVAISIQPTKFATHTVVMFYDGKTFRQIEIPEYERFDWEHAIFGSEDSTHREPCRWLRNGDLLLDITMGYHTKSEGPAPGYFATLHFAGTPPKAAEVRRTRTTDRDDQ